MCKTRVPRLICALFLVLVCASCTTKSLTCEVVGLSSTAIAKSDVAFKVIVRNDSRTTQILPARFEVDFTTSIRFIPKAQPGMLLSKLRASGQMFSGDSAITRNSMSISPPQFDHLKSGDTRVYDFTWTPAKDDRGVGALSIELPFSFPEIPLQPMTVQAEQEAAMKDR